MTGFFDTPAVYGALADLLRILGYGGLALFVLALAIHSGAKRV